MSFKKHLEANLTLGDINSTDVEEVKTGDDDKISMIPKVKKGDEIRIGNILYSVDDVDDEYIHATATTGKDEGKERSIKKTEADAIIDQVN